MGGVLKMGCITKRIERSEERLGLNHGPITINVVWFGGEPVPPEERHDNVIVRHVAYESVQKRWERGTEHEH